MSIQNKTILSPFKTSNGSDNQSQDQMSVLSNGDSPFNPVTEYEYQGINDLDKKHEEMYIIKSNNNNLVNEIKTIFKYVLISFRDINNQILGQKRMIPGEYIAAVDLPQNNVYENLVSNHMEYSVYYNWKNENSSLPGLVPSHNAIFRPDEESFITSRYAWITVSANGEAGQTDSPLLDMYWIQSKINLFIKNTNFMGYIFNPTVSRTVEAENIVHEVSIRISNLIYKPGQTEYFEPVFKLYTDAEFINELCEITIRLNVTHQSGQPIGD